MILTPAEILELLARYGPGAIFILLWWVERSERRDSQKELGKISRDTITALTELKGLIGQLSEIFRAEKRR